MADLFTRTEVDFGGAMHAQNGIVADVGGTQLGILLQNIQIQYSQQVTRLYELGRVGDRTSVYYVSGRAQGTMNAAHVIGPGSALAPFYEAFSDVCQARCNNILIDVSPNICDAVCGGNSAGVLDKTNGLTPGTPSQWTLKFCVLTQVGMTVAAQDFVVNSSAQIMFSGMAINTAAAINTTPSVTFTPNPSVITGITNIFSTLLAAASVPLVVALQAVGAGVAAYNLGENGTSIALAVRAVLVNNGITSVSAGTIETAIASLVQLQ